MDTSILKSKSLLLVQLCIATECLNIGLIIQHDTLKFLTSVVIAMVLSFKNNVFICQGITPFNIIKGITQFEYLFLCLVAAFFIESIAFLLFVANL